MSESEHMVAVMVSGSSSEEGLIWEAALNSAAGFKAQMLPKRIGSLTSDKERIPDKISQRHHIIRRAAGLVIVNTADILEPIFSGVLETSHGLDTDAQLSIVAALALEKPVVLTHGYPLGGSVAEFHEAPLRHLGVELAEQSSGMSSPDGVFYDLPGIVDGILVPHVGEH